MTPSKSTIIELNEKVIELQEENTNLQIDYNHKAKELEKKNNIIKEVREYIEQDIKANYFERYDDEVYKLCDELLEILNKGE